jgi:hypothetical protein
VNGIETTISLLAHHERRTHIIRSPPTFCESGISETSSEGVRLDAGTFTEKNNIFYPPKRGEREISHSRYCPELSTFVNLLTGWAPQHKPIMIHHDLQDGCQSPSLPFFRARTQLELTRIH